MNPAETARQRRPEPVPAAPVRADEPAGGWLATAIKIPVWVVVFAVVLPVRLLRDAVVAGARAVHRSVLAPIGHGLRWLWRVLVVVPVSAVAGALAWCGHVLLVVPLAWLYRYVLAPLGSALVVTPLVWLYRHVLTPIGHGLGWLAGAVARLAAATGAGIAAAWRGVCAAAVWVAKAVLVWPWVALWRYVLAPLGGALIVVPARWLYHRVLTPVGHGVSWLAGALGAGLAVLAAAVWNGIGQVLVWTLVLPVGFLWRHVLGPVLRSLAAGIAAAAGVIADALAQGWYAARVVSKAIGRAVRWLGRVLLVRPARWLWRVAVRPVVDRVREAGRWTRRHTWEPARRAMVEARRSVGRMLRSARQAVRQALGRPVP